MNMESWMKITAATMVVIWVFNRVVDRIWPVPQVLRDKKKEWWWSYIITGQIFTCMASCGSLYCFYEKPAMFEDLVNSSSPASYNLVAIALGYFAVETIDVYFYAPKWWFFICFYHHTSLVAVYVVALINQKYIALSVSALLMEIYSTFLYFHRILRAVGANESGKVYRINTLFVLGTLILRLIFMCWFLYFVFNLWKRVPLVHYLVGVGATTYVVYESDALLRNALSNFAKAWLNHRGEAK